MNYVVFVRREMTGRPTISFASSTVTPKRVPPTKDERFVMIGLIDFTTSAKNTAIWLGWYSNFHKNCIHYRYESAIYACYYRLAPILTDPFEKKCVWHDARREYAEIFIMGRRIWRRPIHHSRLRVFYDLAMLCVRFGEVEDDTTCAMFRDMLADKTNFDFSVLTEVEFAKSIDKVGFPQTKYRLKAKRPFVDFDLGLT